VQSKNSIARLTIIFAPEIRSEHVCQAPGASSAPSQESGIKPRLLPVLFCTAESQQNKPGCFHAYEYPPGSGKTQYYIRDWHCSTHPAQ